MAGARAGRRVSLAWGAGSVGCSWGEGDADMGRPWSAWWRPGERQRREWGPGKLRRCLREQERHEWGLGAGEARWCRGERESRGRDCLAGEEGEGCRL